MQINLDRYQWAGWLGLMTEYIYAFSFTSLHALPLVILYIALAAVCSYFSVRLMGTGSEGYHREMLMILPSSVLMLFANLVFGFNVVLPFVCFGICSVALTSVIANAEKTEGKTASVRHTLLTCGIAVMLYLILTLSYGIFS